MEINNVLIDTNICLDAVLNRKPFAANALEITERAQMGDFVGAVASHSFDTIFYFLRKDAGIAKAYKGLDILRKAFKVASVTQSVIDKAIGGRWNDFEDAIHYYTARASGCDAIITRNRKDFTESTLPILSPSEFLARPRAGNQE
jgi:predicted nucleic acid-binding protein